jgi:hypothetical protein
MAWGLGGLFGLVCSAMALAGAEQNAPPGLFIQIDQGLLTVKAQAISQRQILEELGRQLHFELIIGGPLEEQQSLDLESQPWEEGLKKALAPANWAALYRSTAGTPRLSQVMVWPRAQAPPPRALSTDPPGQPLEARGDTATLQRQLDIYAPLAELLAAENDEVRAAAVAALANTGGEQAVAAVTSALHDQEPWVRGVAVEALAVMGGEPAVRGLQQALQDDNPDVQQAAQEVLAQLQQQDE